MAEFGRCRSNFPTPSNLLHALPIIIISNNKSTCRSSAIRWYAWWRKVWKCLMCVNEKISICCAHLPRANFVVFIESTVDVFCLWWMLVCWFAGAAHVIYWNVQTKDHNSSKIVYRCAIARFRFPLSSVHAADIEDVVVVEEDVDDDERQRRRRQSCAQIFIYLAVFLQRLFFFLFLPHIRLKWMAEIFIQSSVYGFLVLRKIDECVRVFRYFFLRWLSRLCETTEYILWLWNGLLVLVAGATRSCQVNKIFIIPLFSFFFLSLSLFCRRTKMKTDNFYGVFA